MELTRFDAASYLINNDMIAGFLNAVLEEQPALFPQALGTVVRARGVSQTAKATGLSRETIYSAFKEGSNPTHATITKVLDELGLRTAVVSK